MGLGIAVDGLGNLYIASSFGNQIYSYDPQGEFVDRFGQQGVEPGQLSSPGSLAVDGQKRLYVHHNAGIDQFDTGGRSSAGCRLITPRARRGQWPWIARGLSTR